jgi:hypothetical protein
LSIFVWQQAAQAPPGFPHLLFPGGLFLTQWAAFKVLKAAFFVPALARMDDTKFTKWLQKMKKPMGKNDIM